MGKNAQQPQKLNAAQRIEGLENALAGVMRNNQILAGEIDNLRQTMGALARRLNATIQSGEQGNLSNDSVNDIITQQNASELKGKVDFLIEQGVLSLSDTGEVLEGTFVVGRELGEDKSVINPRIQFAMSSVHPDLKSLLIGKKVGDMVKNEEGDGLFLEITEVFNVVERVEKKFDKEAEASE